MLRFNGTTNLHDQSGSLTRAFLSYPFANVRPNPFPTPGGISISNDNILDLTVAD